MKIKRRKFVSAPIDYNPDRPIDELLAAHEEKYLLINLISRRSRDLNEGARALVSVEGPHNFLDVALQEAREGKLKVARRELAPVGGEESEASDEETE